MPKLGEHPTAEVRAKMSKARQVRAAINKIKRGKTEEKSMHPYLGPSGAGMTTHKGLADRMDTLRSEYIEACKRQDDEAEKRILKDEREIIRLLHDEAVKERLRIAESMEISKMKMPRCIRVTHFEISRAGRGSQETILNDRHVYLDLNEVEMIMTDKLQPAPHRVIMKSGRELSVSEDDFNRIERAMRERE